MSRRAEDRPAWRWSRLIPREEEDLWSGRLGATGKMNWMIVEKPGRRRLSVEAYVGSEREAKLLQCEWKGRIAPFAPAPPPVSKPVRIGTRLVIVHDEGQAVAPDRLIIPYGMAFGSGEHGTTLMLLRALTACDDLATKAVLDLGTGSGVLALAARKFGAMRVNGTDFDPAAIRTARANERLNFHTRRVHWEVADVARLPSSPRYNLILANLFSGILVAAAPRMARAVAPGGELWLSGVLRSQSQEVAGAFERAGLLGIQTKRRGKWVLQRWTKPTHHRTAGRRSHA